MAPRQSEEPTDPEGKKLFKGARSLGVRLSGPQIKALQTYHAELKRWNLKVNLTSLEEDDDIIEKHFLDSLGGVGLIPLGEARVLDIGSGAGFPGLVFKIARPEISLTLLEPNGKKAAFLHHVCGRLGLRKTEVIPRRLEDLGRDFGCFDLCVSRALAAPEKLLDACRLLVGKEGRVALFEGRPRDPGIPERQLAWSREAHVYRLPLSGIVREIGVYKLI